MRQIGEGGMGSVWLATHLGLGIPCAIKFVEGEWRRQPEMVTRFEREAKVEAQLRSPHVVHVLDHGVWNGTPYIAMEYLEGESLAQRLERAGRIDIELTHRVVAHVARALTRAHAIGIVHRDLKPENIFLVPGDEGEVAKVLDFGVAKWNTDWVVSSVTKTGLLVGTPLYMSPEQSAAEKSLDGRSDEYSLGCVLYEMLAGKPPFGGRTARAIIAGHLTVPPPRILDVRPDLAPGVQWLTQRMLAKDREARPGSAEALIHDIDHYDALEPPGAAEGWWARLVRRLGRSRG
jgi:serine/threonine protein kinase